MAKRSISLWVPVAVVAGLMAVSSRAKARSSRVVTRDRYVPGSARQIALFEEAADLVDLPRAWASDPGLINILKSESDGRVGVPNYTYGKKATDENRWPEVWAELKDGIKSAKSSATGLGQLILANVETYYPDGRAGIGNALNEAAGMLRYIEDRYGTPSKAWRVYGKLHEGY